MYLSTLIPENIEITTKQNWNGHDLVQLKNLYLAEDYNKFIALNDSIKCISGISTSSFINFFDNLPNNIIDIVSTEYKFVPSLNGKTGDIYGISGIIINNETYWPTNENNYIIDLGDYLSASTRLVYTFNNISGAVSGIQSINNIKPNRFGKLDLGDYYQNNINIVESINGLSGDISGIVGFIIDKKTYTYTSTNEGNLNLYIPLTLFMNRYDFLPISGAIMYGHPTCSDCKNGNDNNIANLGYLRSRIGKEYLAIKTIYSEDTNYCTWNVNELTLTYPDSFIQFLNCYKDVNNKKTQLNLNTYFKIIKTYREPTNIFPTQLRMLPKIKEKFYINLLIQIQK